MMKSRVVYNRHAQRSKRDVVRERISPLMPDEIAYPVGAYRVQLLDPVSGKVTHQEDKGNYVSPVHKWHQISKQHLQPMDRYGWVHQGIDRIRWSSVANATADDPAFGLVNHFWNPNGQVGYPGTSLVCTDDTSAEDSTDHWLKGTIIAQATLWKPQTTIPSSGVRGIVNETEMVVSNRGLTRRWVFDWTTQQGNGTFQTVGVADTMGPTSQYLWVAHGPGSIVLPEVLGGPVFAVTANWYSSPKPAGGTKAYYIAHKDNASSNVCVYSIPWASIFSASNWTDDPFCQNATGLTPTMECDLGLVGSLASSGGSTTTFRRDIPSSVTALRLGDSGDFVHVQWSWATTTSAKALYARRVTAAGTQVWATNPVVSEANLPPTVGVDVAYDGTWLYVASANTNKIFRLNPADGTLSATITMPTQAGTGYGAIWYLGGGNFVVGGVGQFIIMDDEGTYVLGLGDVFGTLSWHEQGASPWVSTSAGGFNAYGPRHNHQASVFGVNYHAWFGASDLNWGLGSVAGGAKSGMTIRSPVVIDDNGGMWLLCETTKANCPPAWRTALATGSKLVVSHLNRVIGLNCFSRTRLVAPVEKNTSMNMKISYELTYPDYWQPNARPVPVNPLADFV